MEVIGSWDRGVLTSQTARARLVNERQIYHAAVQSRLCKSTRNTSVYSPQVLFTLTSKRIAPVWRELPVHHHALFSARRHGEAGIGSSLTFGLATERQRWHSRFQQHGELLQIRKTSASVMTFRTEANQNKER